MLGRYVSDLEVGDLLGPSDRVLTPFLIREYAHGVENASPRHTDATELTAPPTIFHAFKGRLFHAACPEGAGPVAILHAIYSATHHDLIPSSRELSIHGEVTDRYERRGRESVEIHFEVRDKGTGQLYTSYEDTTLLSYRQRGTS